jgi:hypothetical protein
VILTKDLGMKWVQPNLFHNCWYRKRKRTSCLWLLTWTNVWKLMKTYKQASCCGYRYYILILDTMHIDLYFF